MGTVSSNETPKLSGESVELECACRHAPCLSAVNIEIDRLYQKWAATLEPSVTKTVLLDYEDPHSAAYDPLRVVYEKLKS